MKRLTSGLLASVLMVGAMVPAPAFAESTDAAGKLKVEVVNVRPEDIGPATYSESIFLIKPDKETTVVRSGLGGTEVTSVTTNGKKAGWYVAENTLERRALIGVFAYRLIVMGEFHSSGRYIDEYGETDFAVDTNITWSSSAERSQWSNKSKSSGKAKASAIFKNEIPTPWGGIQIRQVSESVTATARP